MARYSSTTTASSTGTWVYYSDSGTATANSRRFRVAHNKATFHCCSCKKSHDGNGKTHPDYPDLLICNKCTKERNKHLILVTDVEKI